MTKRIFHGIIAVALIVLISSFSIILGSLYNYFSGLQLSQLKSQLEFAVSAVENEGISYLETLDKSKYRLTLVAPDGSVLYDSESDSEQMENHKNRAEIRQAMETGYGESDRYSTTLTQRTINIAKQLSDGRVLRISLKHLSIITMMIAMFQPFLVILLIALIISFALASTMAKRIVEPLNELSLDNPLENDVYDELSPLLRHIDSQNKQIAVQIDELSRKQNEFTAITENMSEGLVLLGVNGNIISINSAAKKLFSVDDTCVGSDFLSVERSPAISDSVRRSLENGYSEIVINRSGRDYSFRSSRIEDSGSVAGLVLLIIDITEKMQAEQNRREFTANVSHELKTPLQSIMGSAELLENGMVKPEDTRRFVGHIRAESSRLLTLINDIIRLSQLDETVEIHKETVDVYAEAKQTVALLAKAAEEKQVTVALEGESALISGVSQLVHEIVYNLCDNAIKYNRTGGSVNVEVHSDGENAVLVVSDTGIGIPVEHHERIFERFYRVDKSHSKETGGTGLGLSIVKHAVQYLGGAITLDSAPGSGTTITVTFPGSE